MRSEGAIYRPPGERNSYLLQATVGCSHNACSFCAMYKDKRYHVRPMEDILEDIRMAGAYYGDVSRVFLCDGDAIGMPTEDLLRILHALYSTFPSLTKVGTYAGPIPTLGKTPEELRELRAAGLTRVYLGVETGSDGLLKEICKGVTAEEMLKAGVMLREVRCIVENVTVDPLHFTCDHASNYLPLKGTLSEERERFLTAIDRALAGELRLRPEFSRGV